VIPSKKHAGQPGISPWVFALLALALIAIVFARLHLRSFIASATRESPPATRVNLPSSHTQNGGGSTAQGNANGTPGAASSQASAGSTTPDKDVSPGLLINMQQPNWSDVHSGEVTWFIYEIRDAMNMRVANATVTATATRTDGMAPAVVFHPGEYKEGLYAAQATFPLPGKWEILVEVKKGDLNLGFRRYRIDVQPARQAPR
jgi:hypothetical protein